MDKIGVWTMKVKYDKKRNTVVVTGGTKEDPITFEDAKGVMPFYISGATEKLEDLRNIVIDNPLE